MANRLQEIKYTQLFIDNEFVDAKSGKKFATINPATEETLAMIAEADKEDVDLAVEAAERAFKRGSEYRKMNASARGKLLFKLAELIERDIDILANLETLDNGKPYAEAVFDIECVADVFRYYAGWCDKVHGNTIPTDGELLTLTRKEPIGIVGQIIPWNYPLLMLAWKWGPAIATGCTIVLKPAEQTPLTALYAAHLAKEVGFPKGVINVVPGFGPTAGQAIAAHPKIRKVAFTGSVPIGKSIMAEAAKSNLKKVSLELGGKSPLVIFDDVDVDEAVGIAFAAIFTNHGQNCCAGSRTFVQSGIYEKFVRKAAEMAVKRKLGNPYDDGVEQGPQISEKQMNRILHYIELGKNEGAKLICGGKRFSDKGYFVEPTIFSNVTNNMTIAQEEIFGPVQTILKFDTLDDVIEKANDTTFGLAAGVVTNNINNALVFSQAVEAGSVWVNCYDAVVPQAPFGGYKQSGFGRELGEDSLESYLETKTISIKLPCKN